MAKKVHGCGKVGEQMIARKIPLSAAASGNGFIFVSGLPPVDWKTGELVRGDILVQTRQCLENVKRTLEEAGSSMDKVLKVVVYITNAVYFNDVNKIYAEYFPDAPPARSFITVGSWPFEFDIEIEAIALS